MLMTGTDNHPTGMGTLVETVTPEQRELSGYSMVWDDDQDKRPLWARRGPFAHSSRGVELVILGGLRSCVAPAARSDVRD